ncbi:MAG: hypothetical protein MR691_15010 [Clostridium sp.]|nr:hypothetical protein [Clostridium sp.]
MNKEEIKEYLKRVDELEFKLVDEDKGTLQWLIFGYNECARLLNEKEKENQELKKQYCERTDCSGRLGNSKKVDQLEKELEQLKKIEKEHQRINGDLRVEIKELKEKYMKLEDKYIHNVSCCNEEDCDLFCEHQELKKQLEEWKELLNKFKTQQKEFIKYLEDEIKRTNPKELDIGELNLRLDDIKFTQYLIYKEILQKYKEIIGDKE